MWNFIDLFCGAGGFAKGFEMTSKFKCIGGIDNNVSAIQTHAENFPESISICQDIRDVSPEDFQKKIGGQTVDVIIGGPPCPTFSTIGHAKIQSVKKDKGSDITKDHRNVLFLDFLEYVKYFQPKVFVMENVPQFLTKYKGKTFESVKEIIATEMPLYEIVEPVRILNSVNFGVPQTRRRMILVGHLKGLKFSYPEITHYYNGGKRTVKGDTPQSGISKENLLPHVSIKSAISDLPEITDNWRQSVCKYKQFENLDSYQKMMRMHTSDVVSNNICRMTNDRAKIVFQHMRQGDIYMDLAPEIRQVLPFREDIFKDRLKRLIEDDPSWTILAHIGMDGYMYIHPTEQRTLSVREAARIQSFPDDFIFVGNQQETYMQVGNAVPPLLGKAVGEKVGDCLSNENV